MTGTVAWLGRHGGRRQVQTATAPGAGAASGAAAPPPVEAALAALDPAPVWPDGLVPRPLALAFGNGAPVWLWCGDAWHRGVDETAAALDLAAADTALDWLERMEDRLLDAAQGDPGDYAALACWSADPPADPP